MVLSPNNNPIAMLCIPVCMEIKEEYAIRNFCNELKHSPSKIKIFRGKFLMYSVCMGSIAIAGLLLLSFNPEGFYPVFPYFV